MIEIAQGDDLKSGHSVLKQNFRKSNILQTNDKFLRQLHNSACNEYTNFLSIA